MTASDIPVAQLLGASQRDTVWVRGTAVGTLTFSGVLIRGQEHDYVLTAAHGVSFSSGTFTAAQISVGTGPSYVSAPGATSGASSLFISPSFVPGTNTGLDYAFIRLQSRLSPPDLIFSIAPTPAFNEEILFSGYGVPEVMTGDPVPNTGDVMGFFANFTPAGPVTWNAANASGNFNGNSSSGYGTSRDSGGSVKSFNPLTGKWQNLGMMIGAGGSGSYGFTVFLKYNAAGQVFTDYLNNVVRPITAVAEIPRINLTASGASAELTFANLIPLKEYRIMRSTTLGAWGEAHRFTPTSATDSWSEALQGEGKAFYRLEWDP